MGVPHIPGADNGSGRLIWHWNASNQSANMRYGALVALSLLPSNQPIDVVLPFEVVSGSRVDGPIVGVNTMAGPEPTLTTALAKDGVGVTHLAIASGIGRADFILSPSQSPTQANPFLIPDPANPGNVMVRPVGSGVAPVARALTYPASSPDEQLVEAEFMSGLSVGLDGMPSEEFLGDATDTVTTAFFVPTAGVHVNPAAPKNTPVLYRARVATRIFGMQANLEVAAGVGNGVRYEFRIGATAAIANAAVASSFIDVLNAALSAVPTGGATDPTSFIMPAGTVLVVNAVAQGGGVGTAEHSGISFKTQ
jgi:hypothetical protein